MDKSNPAYVHGHAGKRSFSPTYHSWASMIQRCTNPNTSAFKWYGARGIGVCADWLNFAAFLQDMGVRPDGTSLDRRDNNLGYSPDNCRWATPTEQARNSTQVVWVTLGGTSKRLVEWCEELGISINTVRDRVKHYGFSYEDALTAPIQKAPFTKVRR